MGERQRGQVRAVRASGPGGKSRSTVAEVRRWKMERAGS